MEDKKYWIWLSRISKIKPSNLYMLVKKYKMPKIIWYKTCKDLIQDGLDEETAKEITNEKNKQDLNENIEYMKVNGIEIITILDKEYPNKLRKIFDPPIALYIKGNKDILNDLSIAIVGSRDCTDYGRYVAEKLSYQLAKHNINIISGLAKGIDAKAHIGTLKAKGKTIAVVGSGLDIIYPKQNEQLYNSIIENEGTIISEYCMGTKPLAEHFPARNRIVSGLANGIVVVEAGKCSGALITVDYALEEGKEIYVVPGNITSITSLGTNNLIKEGAKLVTNVKDILEDL